MTQKIELYYNIKVYKNKISLKKCQLKINSSLLKVFLVTKIIVYIILKMLLGTSYSLKSFQLISKCFQNSSRKVLYKFIQKFQHQFK
jgi:hypothetical protein